MMRLLAKATLLCLLATPLLAQKFTPQATRQRIAAPTNAPTSRSFASPNGKFILTLEISPVPFSGTGSSDTRLLAAVWTNSTPPAATSFWSKYVRLPPRSALPSLDETYLSDEADFFVIPEQHRQQASIHKTNFGVLRFDLKDPYYSFFQSLPEIIYQIDHLNNEPIIAIWQREQNIWQAYKISDGQPFTPNDKDAQRWTEKTRQEIILKLQRARHFELIRKARALSKPIASLANELAPEPAQGELRQSHLEFLAIQRNPADRHLIEQFLQPKNEADRLEDKNRLGRLRSFSATPFHVESTDPERAIADRLLAIWNNKVSTNRVGHHPMTTRYHLGTVTGTIDLPLPFTPSGKGELIRLLLLPAGVSNPTKSPLRETEDFRGETRRPSPRYTAPSTTQITFAFTTVLPGKYRFKAIWDKRAPYTDTNAPGPGDYETTLTQPFQVLPGQTNFLTLHCTNQLTDPSAQNYYAADQLRRAQTQK